MLDNVASPAVRQKRSKLAPTSCQASSMFAAGTTAVNVVGFFMALLSFRGFDTPSLPAQGEQRLPLIFNIQRGNAASGIVKPRQTFEIQIAAIHDVEGARLGLKKIENFDIVHLAIADVDERGNAAAKIEQRV